MKKYNLKVGDLIVVSNSICTRELCVITKIWLKDGDTGITDKTMIDYESVDPNWRSLRNIWDSADNITKARESDILRFINNNLRDHLVDNFVETV